LTPVGGRAARAQLGDQVESRNQRGGCKREKDSHLEGTECRTNSRFTLGGGEFEEMTQYVGIKRRETAKNRVGEKNRESFEEGKERNEASQDCG